MSQQSNSKGFCPRVAIATSGRFHVLDLARELDRLGVDIHFYSYVSKKRAEAFGLPRRCHVALLPLVFPLVGLERLFPKFFPSVAERLGCWALDIATIIRMRRCDVFICMSGIFVWAPRFARWRYGARIMVHRGSRHILSQKEILAHIRDSQQVTPFMVKRELIAYEIADVIVIPSLHVKESFEPWPHLVKKLFVSLYGVDLAQFPLRKERLPSDPTVIFVGSWSYQKGADTLSKAIEKMKYVKLLHVGAVLDVPLPRHPRFTHHAPVPQWTLQEFYASAHVAVLASRQDGFGMVLCQALASGLPVICTDRTGGPDLANLPGFRRLVRIVPTEDVEALREALSEMIEFVQQGQNKISEPEREMLGWRRYASENLDVIQKMLYLPQKAET